MPHNKDWIKAGIFKNNKVTRRNDMNFSDAGGSLQPFEIASEAMNEWRVKLGGLEHCECDGTWKMKKCRYT